VEGTSCNAQGRREQVRALVENFRAPPLPPRSISTVILWRRLEWADKVYQQVAREENKAESVVRSMAAGLKSRQHDLSLLIYLW